MVQSDRKEMWVGAGLMVLVLLVYTPVIFGGGFFWDDHMLLLDNKAVWSARGLWDIWFSTRSPDYYPLMSTSYWLEAHLWGREAPGYHLTNALLHGGSAILLWRILVRLRMPGAIVGALLFAISPINVESVAWIAERKNTLSMFLACAAVLWHLRAEDGEGDYGGAWALFLGALLSKTAVVMLPVALLILAWARRGRITKADGVRALPYFALSLVLGLVTVWFQYHRAIAEVVVREDSPASRLATAGCAVWFYLGKALFPFGLMFNYPRWEVMRWGPAAFLPGAALLLMLALLWKRRQRRALAGLLIYLLLLLPMLGFLNIFFMRYALVSDHWQYHATAALYGLAGAGAAMVWQQLRGAARRAWVGAAAGVAVLWVGQSVALAALYRRDQALWADTLRRNPSSWLAAAQMGMAELAAAGDDSGKLAAALNHLELAAKLAPDQAEVNLDLGAAYQRAGRLDEALAAFDRAYQAATGTNNDRASAKLDEAGVNALRGNLEAAMQDVDQALEIEPTSAPGAARKAAVLVREGDIDNARAWYRRAIERDPSLGEARFALAKLAVRQGDLREAAEQLGALNGLSPDDPSVRAALAQLAGAPATR